MTTRKFHILAALCLIWTTASGQETKLKQVHTSVFLARLAGAGFTFSFGVVVEILQAYHVQFLGTTYDPLDILMYAIGVGLGILLDLTLLDRLEKSSPEDHQSAGK